MENIDAMLIDFDEGQLLILNICLAFLTFGIALDIRVDDFKDVFRAPKLPLIGLTSQLLLLPLLNLLLIYLLQPPPTIALGMVLVASCPGGNISNYAVHLSNANVALSLTLTSISTLSAVLVTPLAFVFWSSWIPNLAPVDIAIQVSFFEMAKILLILIALPLAAAMFLAKRYPRFIQKIQKGVQRLSLLIFFFFVMGAIIANYENMFKYIYKVFHIVLIYNGLAFLLGYYFARLFGLKDYDAKAISIETGIQNTALALILVFNFFDGKGGMALIAACWGIWHLIVVFLLALWWGRERSVEV